MSRASPANRRLTLADIAKGGSGLPSRGVVHGPEGTGKTSLGCAAARPVYLMTRGETGLLTLIDSGRVPETPHFPELMTWTDLLAAIEVLTVEPHDYRTVVLDTLNGAERLCHEHVCGRDYEGRWGRDGFASYMTGYDVSLADWRLFLDALDRLREQRRMAILALCHTRISTYKNPEGPDFDRFTPDLHPKTWGLTHKWADFVLFLNFTVHVDAGKNQGKAKGKGGTRRTFYTQRTATYDAKNRHGLPEQIDAGDSAAEGWANLMAAMRAGRAKQQTQDGPADVPQGQDQQAS
jgi:hypothetical protein